MVAWLDTNGTAIYGLRVGDFGEPIGFETAIVAGSGTLALAAIEPDSDGFASIIWEGLSVDNPTPVGGEVIETDWFPTGWTCW